MEEGEGGGWEWANNTLAPSSFALGGGGPGSEPPPPKYALLRPAGSLYVLFFKLSSYFLPKRCFTFVARVAIQIPSQDRWFS